MNNPLLIVGASGRAAAASALRAVFEPFVIDLFADADTVRLCPTLRCDPVAYPHGFIELAKQAPPGPWMYTGGLENHPDVIAAISETRLLWGNGPEELATVRDPQRLAALVKLHLGRCPETFPLGAGPPPGVGPWLRKPLASGGGRHIRVTTDADFEPGEGAAAGYLQRLIDGVPMSAVFRAGVEETWLFAVTTQLIGTPWLHAPPFGYAGNVECRDRSVLRRLLQHFLAFRELGLTQCWGVDFILPPDGVPWTIEVNPRYTAAVEIRELASGSPFLGPPSPPKLSSRVVGKAIYYAAVPITFPASGPWDASLARCTDVWPMPDFADIPHPGSVIEAGQPVFTLFAAAATEEECVNQLKAKAAACDRLFGVPTPEGNP